MGGVVARHMSHAVTANGRALNQLLTVPASRAGPYSTEARPSRTTTEKNYKLRLCRMYKQLMCNRVKINYTYKYLSSFLC